MELETSKKYLYGRLFTILTDSMPVRLIFGEYKAMPSSVHPRVLRWVLFLSGYQYKIIFNTIGKW